MTTEPTDDGRAHAAAAMSANDTSWPSAVTLSAPGTVPARPRTYALSVADATTNARISRTSWRWSRRRVMLPAASTTDHIAAFAHGYMTFSADGRVAMPLCSRMAGTMSAVKIAAR